jgi:hypothetical protein
MRTRTAAAILFLSHAFLLGQAVILWLLDKQSREALTALGVLGAASMTLWVWSALLSVGAIRQKQNGVLLTVLVLVHVFELNAVLAFACIWPDLNFSINEKVRLAIWPILAPCDLMKKFWLPVLIPTLTYTVAATVILRKLQTRLPTGRYFSFLLRIGRGAILGSAAFIASTLGFLFCFQSDYRIPGAQSLQRLFPDFVAETALRALTTTETSIGTRYACRIVRSRSSSRSIFVQALQCENLAVRDFALQYSVVQPQEDAVRIAADLAYNRLPASSVSDHWAGTILAANSSTGQLRELLNPHENIRGKCREAIVSSLSALGSRTQLLREFKALALTSQAAFFIVSYDATAMDVQELWRAGLSDPSLRRVYLGMIEGMLQDEAFPHRTDIDIQNELATIAAAGTPESAHAVFLLARIAPANVASASITRFLDSSIVSEQQTGIGAVHELRDWSVRATLYQRILSGSDTELCRRFFTWTDMSFNFNDVPERERLKLVGALQDLLETEDLILRRHVVHSLGFLLHETIKSTPGAYTSDRAGRFTYQGYSPIGVEAPERSELERIRQLAMARVKRIAN